VATPSDALTDKLLVHKLQTNIQGIPPPYPLAGTPSARRFTSHKFQQAISFRLGGVQTFAYQTLNMQNSENRGMRRPFHLKGKMMHKMGFMHHNWPFFEP
jgi:hypothetical protein